MTHHQSLRAHLVERAEQGHVPEFAPSNDLPLVEFAKIFAATTLYSFDVNKHLPENAFGNLYELTAETLTAPDATPEVVFQQWSAVMPGHDPATGFRDSVDSAFWGSTPPKVMPPGLWQSAFLLLATSNYVHLSASREQTPPLVRGAIATAGEEYKYVVLADSRR